jgi:hypothetical protein
MTCQVFYSKQNESTQITLGEMVWMYKHCFEIL